jgi:LmbE family N-acetylglucosaminyl deacetylase
LLQEIRVKEKHEIEFVRLVGSERRASDTLASVSKHWQGDQEKFLFVSPHDDDAVLGAGLFMQLVQRENVPVYILIVTDGSMGYCSAEEKETITEIRRQETYRCYESLNIPRENIIWLGFPDCQLNQYRGRRKASANDPVAIEGYTGMQNAFTKYLRQIRPTQCFLPTSSDLHPDHKFVHEELLISLFHSAGDIWPELGKPLDKVPYVHEMGVYCDFPTPPKLRIKATESCLTKKMDAIAAFKSQKQISSLIDGVRQSGPYEYLRSLEFKLYQPGSYYDMFEEKHHLPFIR